MAMLTSHLVEYYMTRKKMHFLWSDHNLNIYTTKHSCQENTQIIVFLLTLYSMQYAVAFDIIRPWGGEALNAWILFILWFLQCFNSNYILKFVYFSHIYVTFMMTIKENIYPQIWPIAKLSPSQPANLQLSWVEPPRIVVWSSNS